MIDQPRLEQLQQRNKRIVKAILAKAERVCPDSIALIGIYGSFLNGDIHHHSDLDLCIVINDDDGWKIGDCFILDDIGYDIYCTPWSRLEEMAGFAHAHVANLMNLDIVYQADEPSLQRYLTLRDKLASLMAATPTEHDLEKVHKHLAEAKACYADMMFASDFGQCKYASAQLLLAAEYLLFAANKTFIRRGVRRVPEEIEALALMPEQFLPAYQALVKCETLADAHKAANILVKQLTDFATSFAAANTERSPASADELRGHYEEVFSNWRNKMLLAAQTNDNYLALMTLASCQNFYDELTAEVDMPRIYLFEGFQVSNLQGAIELFDTGLEQLAALYQQVGLKIRHYATLDDFDQGYSGD